MTPEEQKEIWERGQNALETFLNHFSIEDIESLAEKLNQNPNLASKILGSLKFFT